MKMEEVRVNRNSKRIGKVAKIAVQIIAGGAVMITLAALPGVAGLVPLAEKIFGKRPYARQYNNARTISRLIKEGKIKVTYLKNKTTLQLTDKGKVLLGRSKLFKKIPQKWDGKWRIVSFDIYEKNRQRRDKFRMELKNYGFIKLQLSLWIYPYPCEEFISLLRTDMHFGKNIQYIVAEKIENDSMLRKQFNFNN